LPNNDNVLFDILIRNVQFIENGKTILKDIGINRDERNMDNATKYLIGSRVDDMGDLSTFWGIKELDAKGMTLRFLKDYPSEFAKYNDVSRQTQAETLKRGDEATFILEKNGKIEQIVINGVFMAK
jgi:hypothetical protein